MGLFSRKPLTLAQLREQRARAQADLQAARDRHLAETRKKWMRSDDKIDAAAAEVRRLTDEVKTLDATIEERVVRGERG